MKNKIDDIIDDLKKGQQEFLEWTKYNEVEDDEYLTKLRYYQLIDIVLNNIEKWKRNMFVIRHFTDMTSDEVCELFKIKKHSLYQYNSDIHKLIRIKMKEKYGF